MHIVDKPKYKKTMFLPMAHLNNSDCMSLAYDIWLRRRLRVFNDPSLDYYLMAPKIETMTKDDVIRIKSGHPSLYQCLTFALQHEANIIVFTRGGEPMVCGLAVYDHSEVNPDPMMLYYYDAVRSNRMPNVVLQENMGGTEGEAVTMMQNVGADFLTRTWWDGADYRSEILQDGEWKPIDRVRRPWLNHLDAFRNADEKPTESNTQ